MEKRAQASVSSSCITNISLRFSIRRACLSKLERGALREIGIRQAGVTVLHDTRRAEM